MRLSFAFLDSSSDTLWSEDNNTSVNGTNAGWQGSVETSTFERQFQTVQVPAGTTQLRVNLASGGSSSVIGVMLIDDLSVRLSPPEFATASPPIVAQSGGFNLTWTSATSKDYTVLFTSSLTATPAWTVLASNIPGGFPTTSYQDSAAHGPGNGYYLIKQQ
jgi:hypothetical protein